MDGYTVYLSSADDKPHRIKALRHAIEHIRRRDFLKDDVQAIEHDCHKGDI